MTELKSQLEMRLRVPLASGEAVLWLPTPMTDTDYRLLRKHLRTMKKADTYRVQPPEAPHG